MTVIYKETEEYDQVYIKSVMDGDIKIFFYDVAVIQYWLATSGGRVPVVVVCVLHTQLRICCATDSAIL